AKARTAGFRAVFPSGDEGGALLEALRGEVERLRSRGSEPEEAAPGSDPSLNRLRELGRDMVRIAERLRPRVAEYGEDGPELFGYIESSSAAIRGKLGGLSDYSLHDKELRHDFRN